MENILIWGMGSGAQNLIRRIKNKYEITGITDSFVAKDVKGDFQNIPIVFIENCRELEYDFIIVICANGHEEEIKKYINSVLPGKKVVSVSEFYQKQLFKAEHLQMLENNDLYRFVCNEEHTFIEKFFHYFNVYDTFFHKYRNTDVVICEIGVCKGGSVQMWSDYFGQKATVIGIDINEDCKKYEKGNIYIEIGSQADTDFWKYIKEKYPRIDILLDDGGHLMNEQIVTFEEMFSHISDNGIYLCEDVHTSYWEEYGGTYKGNSFIEYTKDWIDDINACYIREDKKKPNYNTRHMAGLHYYDSMVVIEKRKTHFPLCIKTGKEY